MLRDYIYVGSVTRKAITERFSETEAIQCFLALISEMPTERRLATEGLINPWLSTSLGVSPLDLIVNSDFFLNLFLGAAMLRIVNELPVDLNAAQLKLQATGLAVPVALSRIVTDGIDGMLPALSTVLQRSGQMLGRLSEIL